MSVGGLINKQIGSVDHKKLKIGMEMIKRCLWPRIERINGSHEPLDLRSNGVSKDDDYHTGSTTEVVVGYIFSYHSKRLEDDTSKTNIIYRASDLIWIISSYGTCYQVFRLINGSNDPVLILVTTNFVWRYY